MSRKRLISGAALGVLVALTANVPAAQAVNDDTMAAAVCVLVPGSVSGQAPGVQAIGNDLGAGTGWDQVAGQGPKLLDTDNGTFTFSGPAVCAGADVASNTTGNNGPSVVADVYNISASGRYSNLVCGTGTANGNATITATDSSPPNHTGPLPLHSGGSINATFAITFAGGVGKLSIVITPGGSVSGSTVKAGLPADGTPNGVDGGEGTGVIDIVPNVPGGGNCVTGAAFPPPLNGNGDVTQFLVNGAFETTLSDGNAHT